MEKISKILAVTMDRSLNGQGPGGNCKVVSLVRDGKIINEEEEILQYIETGALLFSNKLYDYVQHLNVNELIEIIPSSINSDIHEGRNFYVSIKSAKKVGNPVIDIPLEYLSADFIDLDLIIKYIKERNLIPTGFNQIYLCDHKSIFGPFKIIQETISPAKGRHTYSFEYNVDELIIDDRLQYSFLLNEPATKIKAIDCSTPAQLIDFLKERLTVDRVDLNLLARIGKTIYETNSGAPELDAIRLNRGSEYIKQLTLSLDELQTILQKKDDWTTVIAQVVDNHKEKFKDLALQDIKKSITEYEVEFQKKISDVASLEDKILKKQEIVNQLKKDLDTITARKDDLVLNIKLLAGLTDNSRNQTSSEIQTFFELIRNENKSHYDNVDDFYLELSETYNIKVPNESLYEDGLFKLKENKFLVANSSEFVFNLLSHTGQCEILIQNAEPDWLKFSYWKTNGLGFLANKADTNPSTNYFYVLQDFNIASFECYGKPLLDISNKIRKSLLGDDKPFPDNLFIILVRADSEIKEFGFDINRSTFKNWCFLPDVSDISKIEFPSCNGIDLHKLNIDRNTKDYSENYF